ncbi:MAG: hypothetical protein HOP15_00225 [Planctomycetes bacterium]|nr:hypothetical protein [Planctomycetota bacterium]
MDARRERRRVTRVTTAIEAELTGPEGAALSIRLENLSVVGLRATTSRLLPEGTRCRIELRADGDTVEARGTVVRAQANSLAIGFEELPFESYERLRLFLLRQADDPAVIAEELSDRLGFLGESA